MKLYLLFAFFGIAVVLFVVKTSGSYSPSENNVSAKLDKETAQMQRSVDSLECPYEGLECDRPGCAEIIECNIGADGKYNLLVVHERDTLGYDGMSEREYEGLNR